MSSHVIDIPPYPSPQNPTTGPSLHLPVSLAIAIGLHSLLLLIPVTEQIPNPQSIPIRLTIVPEDPRKAIPGSGKAQPHSKEIPIKPGNVSQQTSSTTGARREPKPSVGSTAKATNQNSLSIIEDATGQSADNPVDQSSQEGAKSRSTIFDRRLSSRLDTERNKVKKFQSRNTEYMTTTGTFIQNDKGCAEIRKLVPSDIDSNVQQEFKIKCTRRTRSKEDIERLARKYGIP